MEDSHTQLPQSRDRRRLKMPPARFPSQRIMTEGISRPSMIDLEDHEECDLYLMLGF